MLLEIFFFGPPGGYDACDAIACIIRQAQDMRGFVQHLCFIHVTFDEYGFRDFQTASAFGIVT